MILLLLLVIPTLVHGQCCPTQLVSGMGTLDGTYSLAEEQASPPEPVCVDGCVYIGPGNPSDQYCFKSESSSGNVQCSAVTGTTSELVNLEQQKSSAESDLRNLEKEKEDIEADENSAKTLNSTLDDVDKKVEELTADVTSSSRVLVERQAPTTCDEIADIIENIAEETKTNAERLELAQRILQTTITKCRSKDKLTKTKVKIKIIKSDTDIRIKAILVKKTKLEENIKEKKKIIAKLTLDINEIKGITTTTSNPTGEVAVSINSTGEQPVTMEPQGEQPVTMESQGEQPVTMDGFTVPPTGQAAVPMNSTGQQPVEMEPTGPQPVEMNITMSTGQKAVPITEKSTL